MCSVSVRYSEFWLGAVQAGILFQNPQPYATHRPPPCLVVQKKKIYICLEKNSSKKFILKSLVYILTIQNHS